RALTLAETEQSRAHGYPLVRDEKGRVLRAEIAVIALGKLGCRELNYSSDIDLLFLCSGCGEASGAPGSVPALSKGAISNKEFFTGIAERVVEIIGGAREGGRAVYRVDLRLRPYGRDGDLVWPVEKAVNYYRGPARHWERQALIRARHSAGSLDVAAYFVAGVESAVFQPEALMEDIDEINRMRDRIRKSRSAGGINVKLGDGGIRDIEFTTQALQLRFGAREPWIRPAQMLIVLQRLSEKGYLLNSDRSALSSAYTFLRTVEHRVQMDQGAQTHRVPTDKQQLKLLAKRCGYVADADPAEAFVRQLTAHTAAVAEICARLMSRGFPISEASTGPPEKTGEPNRLAHRVSERLAVLVSRGATANAKQAGVDSLRDAVERALDLSINKGRALRNLGLWADALATASEGWPWSFNFAEVASGQASSALSNLLEVLSVTLPSHYLAGILLSRPALAFSLIDNDIESRIQSAVDFEALFEIRMKDAPSIAEKAETLRRTWYPLLLSIGHRDLSLALRPGRTADPEPDSIWLLRQNNVAQTALAEATLREAARLAAFAVAPDSAPADELPLAILGLGRLGHAGMDYGSDLDLLIVYDDENDSSEPFGFGDTAEFATNFAGELVKVLASITREGTLYRVDLRLRPEGASGPAACGISSLENYIRYRASAWEHSAYLKLRELAGNTTFGKLVRQRAVTACFEAAERTAGLKDSLKQIRARLQKEKAKNNVRDIKWGPGGMTDVYFITRYLQLRDAAYFPPEEGTMKLVEHLGASGALKPAQAEAIYEGYLFLRRLDHWIRLLSDKPSSVIPSSMVILDDISKVLRLDSAESLLARQAGHAEQIRQTLNAVFS
ncbi:MAG TPA: hypothetical protein VEZ90_01250, partial [Blastocatellia bacterium]|nr:hypothetical protein [Blastocatellia bacterium]